jgi:hypothetical protein
MMAILIGQGLPPKGELKNEEAKPQRMGGGDKQNDQENQSRR